MRTREISPPQVQASNRLRRLSSPPRQRGFWHIHGRTAVVMIAVASAVVCLNLMPHDTHGDLVGAGGDREGIGTPLVFKSWGYDPSCGVTSYTRWALGIDIVYGLLAVAIPTVLIELRARATRFEGAGTSPSPNAAEK